MKRLTSSTVATLHERLGRRDRELVELIARLRLVSGQQLERVFFASDVDDGKQARARAARRALGRLVALRVLTRLERRIGGVRAGSSGYVYTLGPAGQRLSALWRGEGLRRTRTPYEPGSLFARHFLAISESYVQLLEAERDGCLDLLTFAPEPECWRTYANPASGRRVLKPDAFVRVGVGAYEDRYFLEIDCGSEGRGTLAQKCRAYFDYWRSGNEQTAEGVFPRVLWIATNAKRLRLLVDVCASLPADAWQLFAVTSAERAVELITGSQENDALAARLGGQS